MEFSAEMIAGFLGGEIVGNPKATVSTIAKIEEGKPGALAFLSNPKYEHFIYGTQASVVIVNRSFEPSAPVGATLVKVDDAYASFAKLLELYAANKPRRTGISERAVIDPSARLGENAYVGDFTVIGKNVTIGKNAQIHPQVYIGDNVRIGDDVTLHAGAKIFEECVLGNRVVLNAGAVVGADGFGFAPDDKGVYHKIPQLGNVVLEDDVDLGCNTCVDRGTMGSTVIHRGTKLDNLVQVAHNVSIGSDTVAAAQVGIAGSTKIGSHCMFGGQVGISGHLTIGDRINVGSQSGIPNDLTEPGNYMGYPVLPGIKFHRANALFRKFPEINARISALEKELKKLKEQAGQTE